MPKRTTTSGSVVTLLPKLLDPHREAPDLRDALAALEVEDVDRPLLALARRYAAEIEDAAELTAEAERILERAAEDGEYYIGLDVKRLRRRIELAETVAKLGPALTRVLEELMATPAVRAKIGKKTPNTNGRLSQLRDGIA